MVEPVPPPRITRSISSGCVFAHNDVCRQGGGRFILLGR
jgi:hypothetical protein